MAESRPYPALRLLALSPARVFATELPKSGATSGTMSAEAAATFALGELESGSPAKALVVINNLKKISLALGPDKFKSLLATINQHVADNMRPAASRRTAS